MELQTKRLILRKFQNNKTDLGALFEILSDSEVNKFLPWLPLKTEAETLNFFNKNILTRYQNNDGYYFAICLKQFNNPIGYLTVSGDQSNDFGYGLKKEFWNKGIVTEASIAIMDFLKESGLKYVTATHDINNIGSGKVMEKIGMSYQYTYKEQWQPKDLLVTFRMYQLNFENSNFVFDGYWKKYKDHFIEDIITKNE